MVHWGVGFFPHHLCVACFVAIVLKQIIWLYIPYYLIRKTLLVYTKIVMRVCKIRSDFSGSHTRCLFLSLGCLQVDSLVWNGAFSRKSDLKSRKWWKICFIHYSGVILSSLKIEKKKKQRTQYTHTHTWNRSVAKTCWQKQTH